MKALNIKNIAINSLLFSSILLNNSITAIIIQFSLFVVCVIISANSVFSIPKLFFIHIVFISLLFNLGHIELKDLIRLIQILVAFLFLPLNIDKSSISKTFLGSIMLFIAFMAISNILGLSFESSFKQNYYPIDTNPWSSDITIGDTGVLILFNRYATFYYNPNILGQITLLILVIYLIIIHDKKTTFFDKLVLLSGLVCLVVSGGRTSFLIFCIIMFFTFLRRIKVFYKVVILLIISPFIIYTFSESRLFQIISTDENMDSVGIKFSIFGSYIKSMNSDLSSVFNFFYGTLKSDIQFDNDIGSLFYFIGVLGIIYFFSIYITEFWVSQKEFKPYFAFLLISISATIIFNFKFLILAILILSILKGNKSNLNYNK